ncbi:MAG: hypothetical protein AAF960_23435 [Bacteroidota bacterium]
MVNQDLVLVSQENLRLTIIDCVNACLKTHESKKVVNEPIQNLSPQKYGNAKVCGIRYGVHANTIRNWSKAGYFSGLLVDGVKLFEFAAIDAFLKTKAV